jgi:peptidoglycan hydrolase-like protein with peptidoglycan-binding domain
MPRLDDQGGRAAWFHRPRGGRRGLPGEAYLRAATERRALHVDLEEAPQGGPGSVNWIPLGPFAVTGGQASGHPVVSGRVEAIAAGPGGNRVYVGAADGGVWFSPDGGATWEVLDDFIFLTTPGAPVPSRVANSLAVGALAVRFGADRDHDEVFVGTGEHRGGFRGWFGIGIRVSTSGGSGLWGLEATNLAGLGCVKMAIDPDNPALVLVATTGGLFSRPAVVANRGTWTTVASPVFTNPAGVASDVLIAGTGAAKTYYVAFEGDGVYSSPDLVTWTRVPGGPVAADGRIVLAASEVTPAVVYAFCQTRALFRLTAGSFVAVAGVPRNIFNLVGGPQPQTGNYNIVLAVDPAAADTIYLGGSAVMDQAPGDPVRDWTLALFRGTVTNPAVAPTFPFNAANNAAALGVFAENGDATFVGRGIHPDAQSIAFSRRADNTGLDGTQVWVGCDGGLFRSTASGALGSFTSCGAGLATLQMTYLTSHSGLESVMLAGCQDNGTVRWRSGPVWHEPRRADGGGVAIDPNNRYQMLRQTFRAIVDRTTTGGATNATWAALTFPPHANTPARNTAAATEGNPANTAFYSPIVTTPPGVAPTLVAKGTNRVWLSSNWGTSWVTLPTATDPYAPAVPNAAQDSLGAPVVALAFPSATLLFAATATAVSRFSFAAGAWTRTPLPAIPGVAAATPITSVAAAGGATVYATVGGVGVEHCWYFDGAAWHATGLLATVNVPASTVAIDPNNPTTVFAGTDIGVYRSTRAGNAHSPWTLHSDGLPEAAVMHLEVHQASRTLRAATHGRGAWELPLDLNATPHPELYLRMNIGDNGRRLALADGGPDPDTPGGVLRRNASPDIRVRRGVAAAAPPPFPGRELRLVRPTRMLGDDVRRWQQGVADRGFALPSGVDGIFGRESDTVCRMFQARFGLKVDGIVGPITWPATFAYPTLANTTSALAVELGTPDDIDLPTGATRADSAGANRIFVEVHSRSVHPVDPSAVIVTLLFADNTAALPALPNGYANRIRNRDTTNWLANSGWVFANPGAPYGPIPRQLTASAPQVVEYLVDFTTVGIASKDLLALALVTTANNDDPLTSVEPAALTLVRNDRRAAAKRLLLVP